MLFRFAFLILANSQKRQLAAPSISRGVNTQTTIDIHVVGFPVYGAPAGSSIQWLTEDEYQNNGEWNQLPCQATFSGSAFSSRYQLNSGQSVDISVGDIEFDNGASTTCSQQLVCGTKYLFRAFAHGNNVYTRSPFSNTLSCQTLPCQSTQDCTHTSVYCLNHPETWPVQELQVGSYTYQKDVLLNILGIPDEGDFLYKIYKQLITAKLNIANQASSTMEVNMAIQELDTFIQNITYPVNLTENTQAAYNKLLQYNEGTIGPGQCQ